MTGYEITAAGIGLAFALLAVSQSVRPWHAGRHRATGRQTLREENHVLRARQAAADDFFARLVADRDRVHTAWLDAQQRAREAEQVVACQQEQIEHLAARIELAKKPSSAAASVPPPRSEAAQTGRRIAVMPLHQAHGLGTRRAR